VTSDYPYPGQTGADDGPQGDAYDAPPGQSRPPYVPDGQFTPFAAFGEPSGEEPPAPPKASARAAVRMPPGLVVSSPGADAPPPPPQRGGGVYGASGGGAVYGGQATPADYGQQSNQGQPGQGQPGQSQQPGTYGAPDARVYGRPYGGEADAAPGPQGQQAPGQPPHSQYQPDQYQPDQYQRDQFQPDPYQQGQPQYQQAPPVQQAARPAVPTQRSSGAVYGQRSPAEPDAQPAPAWQPEQPQRPPYAQASAPPYTPAQPPYTPEPQYANEPGQFEQHGRRTQNSGYIESPSQRSIGWQDQLQPLVANPEPQRAPAPSRPAPAPADVAVAPASPKSKLRVVGYVLIVVAVIALGGGALYYTSRTDPPKVGSCVTQSGTIAVSVSCSTSGAFKVSQKVAKVSDCADYLNEPSLSYKEGGKDVVLCLQPVS
jgi:hypothetical protein